MGKDKHHKKERSHKVNDKLARQVEKLWQECFPDATLLPKIGLPSNNNGVLTLTHTDGSCHVMKINGLPSKSPLANNALYSAECSKGHYINLYEIMIPDIPGKCGESSTAEIYVQLLVKHGLHVAGVHFHWWGPAIFDDKKKRIDRGVTAVHHQSTELDPCEFSRRTIYVLKKVLKIIKKRSEECDDKH